MRWADARDACKGERPGTAPQPHPLLGDDEARARVEWQLQRLDDGEPRRRGGEGGEEGGWARRGASRGGMRGTGPQGRVAAASADE